MSSETEYLTSNRLIRYPFEDNTVLSIGDSSDSSYDLTLEGLDLNIFGCFVDAFVQIKSPYDACTPCVTGISIQETKLSFILQDVGNVSHESVTLSCQRSITRFPIVKGETSWCWYVFVLSSEGIVECIENRLKIGNIAKDQLFLSSRCLGRSQTCVSSVLLYSGKRENSTGTRLTRQEALADDPDAIINGHVTFKAGYNMQFGEDSSGFSLNAKEGAGMGIVPCGETTDCVIFKTPGLLSSDGHSRILSDNCYDFSPDRTSKNNGYLHIHAKCKACCTCDMFESIVNDDLIAVRDKINASRSSIASIYEKYEYYVAEWHERMNTALSCDIDMQISGGSISYIGKNITNPYVYGLVKRCGFTVIFRNKSFVSVSFDITKFATSGENFGVQVSYNDENSNAVVLNVDTESKSSPLCSFTLPSGHTAIMTFSVKQETYTQVGNAGTSKLFTAYVGVTARQGTRTITRSVLSKIVDDTGFIED